MKFEISTPYVWSFYMVTTGLSLTLNFAGTQEMTGLLEWNWVMTGLLLISVYSLLTARQLYTHGRLWPKKALLFTFPLSFVHLLFDAPLWLNATICMVNLFFWWAAYRLSGRLAKLSPYGGPSGYL